MHSNNMEFMVFVTINGGGKGRDCIGIEDSFAVFRGAGAAQHVKQKTGLGNHILIQLEFIHPFRNKWNEIVYPLRNIPTKESVSYNVRNRTMFRPCVPSCE